MEGTRVECVNVVIAETGRICMQSLQRLRECSHYRDFENADIAETVRMLSL